MHSCGSKLSSKWDLSSSSFRLSISNKQGEEEEEKVAASDVSRDDLKLCGMCVCVGAVVSSMHGN